MLQEVTDHPAIPGFRFYEEKLKAILEPEQNGQFVAIDGEAELYAVAKTPIEAHDALKAQGSMGWQLLLQVGSDAAFDLFARH
jgi:predicted dithiol-disulfide oxidoreductase (DUF899 family)